MHGGGGVKGRKKWDICNSIMDKIYLKYLCYKKKECFNYLPNAPTLFICICSYKYLVFLECKFHANRDFCPTF